MKDKKSTRVTTSVLIILAFIGFVLGMVWFFIWKKDEIPGQIIGVLFGTIVTAIVTMLLLNAQTKSEEEHEVSGKIFDQKTTAYLNVLDSLEKIISDGKVDTIRDNRLDQNKKDEFSELLFSLTRLSSFVELKDSKKEKSKKTDETSCKKEKDKKTDEKDTPKSSDINGLISAVTEIIKTTTDEDNLPGYGSNVWNGKGKKKINEIQREYYLTLAKSLAEINRFAANNIQRQRDPEKTNFDLTKLVEGSGLFEEPKEEENQKAENAILLSNEQNSSLAEESIDYRVGCVADCLREMEGQLKVEFGDENIKRMGNAGDDIYWGRWERDNATPETIADWLLDRQRRSEIGYSIDLKNGFGAEFCLWGDAKTITVYIWAATDELRKKAQEKHKQIKAKFGQDGGYGWWVPDDFSDWIIGGSYGGDYNGVNLSFDFRNASMKESEYKEAYKKFKENAFQGIISGRDDSIVKTVEELKKLIEG